MSIFDGETGLLLQRRSGDINNPYISIVESLNVNLNRVILKEVPDKFSGIFISNGSTTILTQDVKLGKDPTASVANVDYDYGIITFHSSLEGNTYNFTYKGTGIWALSSNRIFSSQSNGSITTTLKDDEDSRENAETSRVSAESTRVNAESARSSAEASRVSAETTRVSQENARQTNMVNVINSTQLIWKTPVTNFSDIATTYPSPTVGWSVQVTSTNDRYRYDGSTWVKIANYTSTGLETITNVTTIDKSQAQIIRNSIHSGFTKLSPITYLPTTPNTIRLAEESVVYIDGYEIVIPANTDIILDAPPTFGSRTDFAYLRAQFDSATYKLTWSIEKSMDTDSFTKLGYTKDAKDAGLYKNGSYLAVEMFSLKRRNSGGFKGYGNGARDYFESGSYTISTLNLGETRDVTVTETDSKKIVIGDEVIGVSSKNRYGLVIATNGTTVTVKQDTNYNTASGSYNFRSVSAYRPDNLWANIIDASDIIDLRHKVSLTGFNYQQLLEENFDKLLRGELTTKDTKTTTKELFNLQKAPLGLKQELAPVKVNGNDGVERELVNLLGVDGNCEDINRWTGSLSTLSSDSTNVKYGTKAIKTTSNSTGGFGLYKDNITVSPNKSYLVIADINRVNADNASIYICVNGSFTTIKAPSGKVTTTNQFESIYTKISSTELGVNSTVRLYVRANASATGQYVYVDGIRLYEIDQATYDKIDVLPEFTGEELAKKFPHVDSYPNFVENLIPTNVDSWEQGSFSFTDGTISSSTTRIRTKDFIPVKSSTSYSFSRLGSYEFEVVEYKSDGTVATGSSWRNTNRTFTTQSTTAKVKVVFKINDSATITVDEILKVLPQFEEGSVINPFVPYGRHYLPYDYASGQTKHYLSETLSGQRSIMSDAQTSETRTDRVEALKSPQKHIKVTQATEGQWSAGDKIAVSSPYGVVSAVIDSDTAVCRITIDALNTNSFYVDDVSKLAVNDTIQVTDTNTWLSFSRTITSIDTANKMVTVNGGATNYFNYFLVTETTTSTSSPVVTATGIAGTWSGLGTKEATYTITTVPTDNKTDILLQYAINYPAGKGIQYLPSDVLEAEVNGQKLVKTTGNVVLKDNFSGKTRTNVDLVPHIAYRTANTSLIPPSSFGAISEMYTTSSESSGNYTNLTTLDGSVSTWAGFANGQYAQQLFSFNLIEICERKYGEGFFADCVTVADKVARLKSGLVNVIVNWWGYGSSPTGNKASLTMWHTGNAWTVATSINTANTSTKTTYTTTAITDKITSDGFSHFLAYADPSDGVTASTIYTDYVDIELEINPQETGYTVLAPENQMPVLSENMLTASRAFPVEPTYLVKDSSVTITCPELGVLEIAASGTSGDPYATLEQIDTNEKTSFTWTFEAKLISGTVKMKPRIVGWNGASVAFDSNLSLVTLTNNGWTTVSITKNVTETMTKIESRFMLEGNVAGTVQVKNMRLVKSPVIKPFSAGRNKKKILNGLGKLKGDTQSNPFKAFYKALATFDAPSTFTTEYTQTGYDNISKQDGVLNVISTTVNGEYAQAVVELDMSHYNMSLSNVKNLLRKITLTGIVFGEGSNAGTLTYGMTMNVWNANTSAWDSAVTGTASTPEAKSITLSSNLSNYVTKDQKIYLLLRATYASNGTISSKLSLDYVKCEIEMGDQIDIVKSNIVLVEPTSRTIKVKYPTMSYRTGQLDQVTLHYRHIPKQKIANVGVADKEWTKPSFYQIHTVGTGKTTSEVNRWIYELLDTPYNYNGESLHSFVAKGSKQLPFEVDMMASKPVFSGNYVVMAYKIIEKSNQIYLRVIWKESKNLGSYIDLTTSVNTTDFLLSGRPLVKGGN